MKINNIIIMNKFWYIWNMITSDAKSNREIKERIAIGKEAFPKRRKLLRVKLDTHLN